MDRKFIVWSILFMAGLIMILFRMEISRYISDLTALFTVGSILAAIAGAGILIELYRKK